MEALQQRAYGSERGPQLAEAGGARVFEGDLHLVNRSGEELGPVALQGMATEARNLALRRLALRRLAIAEGFRLGIFESSEAASYLAPRIEQLLEDYYYYERGRFSSLQRALHDAGPSAADLRTAALQNPRLAGRDAERLRRRLIGEALAVRQRELRAEISARLVAEHPIRLQQ
ncbi:MAG: hypothetical protein K1X75_14910 [Leptospirales bacterium]|nr:hypothetical protein [Leptospirales bacterium]